MVCGRDSIMMMWLSWLSIGVLMEGGCIPKNVMQRTCDFSDLLTKFGAALNRQCTSDALEGNSDSPFLLPLFPGT